MRRAVLASLILHCLLLAALAVWLSGRHLLPDATEQGVKVELVMLEKAGAGPPASPAPPSPATPPSSTEVVPTNTPSPSPPAPSPAPQPDEARIDLPVPPAPPKLPPPLAGGGQGEGANRPVLPPIPTQPPRSAAPVAAPPGPEMNLGGTDSATDAIVRGDDVVPAKPDTQYRNRQPIYPKEAALRGEQGAVTLVIHVSPAGLPSGVDVTQSSGFVLLDRAAREAVAAWHFLPALRDGQPIAADMPLRVRFELDGAR